MKGLWLNSHPLPEGECKGSFVEALDAGDAGGDAGDAGEGGAATPPGCAVSACSVPEDTRLGPSGCGHTDPFKVCPEYTIFVEVPDDVAEPDPHTKAQDGGVVHESVWVDYFADKGDFDNAVLLISDSENGKQPVSNYTANYIAPPRDADAGADAGATRPYVGGGARLARGGDGGGEGDPGGVGAGGDWGHERSRPSRRGQGNNAINTASSGGERRYECGALSIVDGEPFARFGAGLPRGRRSKESASASGALVWGALDYLLHERQRFVELPQPRQGAGQV